MNRHLALSMFLFVLSVLAVACTSLDDGKAANERIGSVSPAAHTKAAMEPVDAAAQNSLGVVYAEGKGVPQDYAQAAKWFHRAAEQGAAEAQFNLGLSYDKGQGVPQDHAEAMKWYRMAAEQGLADAQNNLGWMYRHGKGVPQDYAEAMKWFRMAAEQGDADAQYSMGSIYYLRQDFVLAHMWFNLAAARGNANAEEARDLLAKQMTPAQIAEAQRIAKEWKPKGQH